MNKLALLNLSKRLSNSSDHVVQKVKMAIEYPDLFIEKYSEGLVERNIDFSFEELLWIALVDELIENGFAFEIDWKESPQNICAVVDVLLENKNYPMLDWGWLQDIDDIPTELFLYKTSQKLHGLLLSLGYLDIDSDSYVLIIVTLDEMASIKSLALDAGYTISDHFGN
ncbi:hypothetical protein D3C77_234540 [compost metagenome]